MGAALQRTSRQVRPFPPTATKDATDNICNCRPPQDYGSTIRSEGEKKNPIFTTGQTESDKEVIKRVQELAEKHGWKMSHVALAWINKRISSPIIGFSSIARMDEALEARGKELTADEEKYLEEPYVARAVQGHS